MALGFQQLRCGTFQGAGLPEPLGGPLDQMRGLGSDHSDQRRAAQDMHHQSPVYHHQSKHRGTEPQADHQALE